MAKAAKEAPKALTKTQIFSELSETTGLTKKQIESVFDSLEAVIKANIGKKGPGVITIPGMLKIQVRTKKATKERIGKSPRTGEEIKIPAKPARKVVKATPLKKLTEMI
ncbi:MAG: HU family DNA-binding protein [Planctomycetia bacterium]